MTAPCAHARQVTPEGRYGWFRCLDCGSVGQLPPATPTRVIDLMAALKAALRARGVDPRDLPHLTRSTDA